MVDHHAHDQDKEPNRLQPLELLPPDGEREEPDEKGAHAVEHHARDGADQLGDADAGKVEESDADKIEKDGDEDDLVVTNLEEAVDGVLKVRRAERADREADVVERDEQNGQDEEAENALPADGLQCRHIVLLDILLLPRHLERHNNLNSKGVNKQHTRQRPVRLS